MLNEETIKRFWEKVDKKSDSECWNWLASKRNKGYGAFCYYELGKMIQGRAHRFSYELHFSPIPKGLFVLHRCDNPACVNPNHLFLGTNQDNVTDMIQKGRKVDGGTYGEGNYKRGEMHHAAKLTNSIIKEIRDEYATGRTSYSKLRKKHGLSIGHLSRIITKKAWKNA